MPSIPLAKAIADLRAELLTALEEGSAKKLRFKLKPVELELKVAMTLSGEANAGVKFWIVDVGTKGELKDEQIHTMKLTLEPVGADGRSEFIISDTGTQRPD